MSITLYTAKTGNGVKPIILLEELKATYEIQWIDIMAGDQFTPEFLAISPNNKIPAIVDHTAEKGEVSIFESGAILLYLAHKFQKFWPEDSQAQFQYLPWLFFQAGSQGPMLGQAHHFVQFAPDKVPYAIERYTKEANRIYGVMNKHLEDRPYFGGEAYTIVDMMNLPWTLTPEWQGVNIADYPYVLRWRDMLCERPAVVAARAVVGR